MQPIDASQVHIGLICQTESILHVVIYTSKTIEVLNMYLLYLQVRAQHTERESDFMVKELKVITKEQVAERIFFISAKEVLQARLQEQKGLPAQCMLKLDSMSFTDFSECSINQ